MPEHSGSSQGDANERRRTDRRELIDLTRPKDLERRTPGSSRRTEDQERYAEQQAVLPPSRRRPAEPRAAAATPEPSKPVEELEADLSALQEAMEARNQKLHELSLTDFEVAQARDEAIVSQWAEHVRRLEREIAAARRRSEG